MASRPARRRHQRGPVRSPHGPKVYNEVSEKLTKAGYKVSEDSGVNFVPTAWTPVTDKAQASGLMKLIEAIEELEDVQNVYMNGDIADEAIEG